VASIACSTELRRDVSAMQILYCCRAEVRDRVKTRTVCADWSTPVAFKTNGFRGDITLWTGQDCNQGPAAKADKAASLPRIHIVPAVDTGRVPVRGPRAGGVIASLTTIFLSFTPFPSADS